MDYANALDCPLEALHCETGPGVWEGALAVTDALDRGRPRERVQDVHEGLLPEARSDGDVHGEVVDEVPGPERPLPLFVLGRRRREPVFRRRRAARHQRRTATRARWPATLSAGVHRDGCADDQQLHAARERRMGADRVHMGHRKPHRGRSSDSGIGEVATHRMSRVRRRCESVSRGVGDHRRCAARCDRTPRARRARDRQCVRRRRSDAGSGTISGGSARSRRAPVGVDRRARVCSATRSSSTMSRVGCGRRANTPARSTTGSSIDTSRSSDADAGMSRRRTRCARSFSASSATIRRCSARC